MSDDLIRRNDAIKAFCIDCKGQGEPCEHSDTCKTMRVLRSRKKIPTIEPKRGEWKFVGSSIEMMWECPFCGEHTFGFEEHLPNYCSNCGADMRKESE